MHLQQKKLNHNTYIAIHKKLEKIHLVQVEIQMQVVLLHLVEQDLNLLHQHHQDHLIEDQVVELTAGKVDLLIVDQVDLVLIDHLDQIVDMLVEHHLTNHKKRDTRVTP